MSIVTDCPEGLLLYDQVPEIIKAGNRDNYFWGLACSFQGKGMSRTAALKEAERYYKAVEQPKGDIFPFAAVIAKIDRAYATYAPTPTPALSLPQNAGGRTEAPGDPPSRDSAELFSNALENWVYIAGTNEVADLSAHPANSRQRLENWRTSVRSYPQINNRLFSACWLNHPQRRTAYDTVYYPSAERLFTQNGELYYNTYVPPSLQEVRYTATDVSPEDILCGLGEGPRELVDKLRSFTDHIRYVFMNNEGDIRHFLRWMAFTLQCPATRIPWAPIIVSSYQGIGKGWLYQLMKILVGPENAYWLGPADLVGGRSAFNEWLSGTLLVVDEIHASYSIYDALKPIITETSNWINSKYGKKEYRTIYCNVLCFTNYLDALDISRFDRRFWVVHLTDPPKSGDYYSRLFRWLDTDGPRYLSGCLRAMDLTGFEWFATPVETKSKARMVEYAKSDIEQCIEDGHLLQTGPFAFDIASMSDICAWVTNRCGITEVTHSHRTTIAKCVHRLTVGDLPKTRYTVDANRRESLVLLRNPDTWTTADEGEVQRYYNFVERHPTVRGHNP